MKQENMIVILPVIGVILIIINYFVYGIKQTSSTIFMLSIYSLFLGSFFFTFGAWIEQETVKLQIESMTDDCMRLYHLFIGDKPIGKITKSETIEEEDKEVNDSNKKLTKEAMMILGLGCMIGIAISIVLSCVVNEDNSFSFMSDIVVKNFVVLLFVGLTQVTFFYFVSRTYKSLDTNAIIRKVIEENE